MSFKSRSFKIAEAVVEHLKEMTLESVYQEWYGSNDIAVVSQFPLVGRNERSKIGRLKMLVTPTGMSLAFRDRCGEEMQNGIAIAVCGAVETVDTGNENMPCSIEELDYYQLFVEMVAEHLQSFRSELFSRRGNISVVPADFETLKTTGIYLSSILLEVQ